jgi:hypothetical protein
LILLPLYYCCHHCAILSQTLAAKVAESPGWPTISLPNYSEGLLGITYYLD